MKKRATRHSAVQGQPYRPRADFECTTFQLISSSHEAPGIEEGAGCIARGQKWILPDTPLSS